MLNRTPVTAANTRLISTGTPPEHPPLAAVARKFPDLTRMEFVSALQDATAQRSGRPCGRTESRQASASVPTTEVSQIPDQNRFIVEVASYVPGSAASD